MIRVQGLSKTFGNLKVLDDLSLTCSKGEIFNRGQGRVITRVTGPFQVLKTILTRLCFKSIG